MKEKIIISGTKFLSAKEKQLVNKLLDEYYEKIKRMIKNEILLEVHIKEYEKTGIPNKAKKFSVHVRIEIPFVLKAEYADWDLARTFHKVMNKLMNEIEHKLHVSEQHDQLRTAQHVRKRGK